MDLTIKEIIKIILLDKKKLLIIFVFSLTVYPLAYALKYYNKYEGILILDTRSYVTNFIITDKSFDKVLVSTFKYHISKNYIQNKILKDLKCEDRQDILMICKIKSLDKGIAENKIQDLSSSINKFYELSINETLKVISDVVLQTEGKNIKNDYQKQLEKEKKEKFFLVISSELKKNQFSLNTYGISIIIIFIFYIFFIIISKENYKK